MSREPIAWVFNLDAEDELARGGPHTPTKVMRDRAESLLPQLRQLLRPGDEIVWPGEGQAVTARRGRAWCPTKWACDTLMRHGVNAQPVPSPEVLRRVNHRRFAHELGQHLPGARFVTTEDELIAALSDADSLALTSTERNWLMKRPLGYAGRGRRKIASAEMNATDRVWVEAALRTGDGLHIEPFVVRELDCALHGWVRRDGTFSLGKPTVNQIDASGTWLSTERASETALSVLERTELSAAATETAQALAVTGYYGPFGLDAFRWRAPDGSHHFQPRCELNARFSMGWAIGMGDFEIPPHD